MPLYDELYAGRAYLPSEHVKPVRQQVAELARRFEIADRRPNPLTPQAVEEQLALAV